MAKIKIITDSTCDLTKELLEKYDITVIPLYVNFKETSFKDGVTIDTSLLYQKVEEYQMLPKTAAITIVDFMTVFSQYIKEDYDIIYTGISKALSSTYNNAVIAANEIDPDRISVIDSMNLSTGIGLNLLRIAKLRDEGRSILVTTHVMSEAELTDRVALLFEGKIIAFDKPKKLEDEYKVNNIEEVFLKVEGE